MEVVTQKSSLKVYVKTSFIGYHRYKDAPEEVSFLRDWHRHIFYVSATLTERSSRELEFFTVQRILNNIVQEHLAEHHFEMSCEDIALVIATKLEFHIKTALSRIEVDVSEDGENGAIYTLEVE